MTTTKEPLGPRSIQLGNTIRRLREQRRWDVRRVANATSSSIELVNDWEAGRDVPTYAQWASLKGAVNHAFSNFTALYREARAEQGFVGPEDQRKPLVTPLAEKLAPVIAAVERVTDPAPVATEPDPAPAQVPYRGAATPGYKYPEGTKTARARNERMEWARAQLRLRPHMPINGPDGLKDLMRHRFGVALSWETMARIKEEITGVATTEENIDVKTPATLQETFEAATQMVMDAVPNLATFSITVDPTTGEAAVAYTIRQVQVVETSGTIKVGGRK